MKGGAEAEQNDRWSNVRGVAGAEQGQGRFNVSRTGAKQGDGRNNVRGGARFWTEQRERKEHGERQKLTGGAR